MRTLRRFRRQDVKGTHKPKGAPKDWRRTRAKEDSKLTKPPLRSVRRERRKGK